MVDIVRLSVVDYDAVISLFLDCFEDDHYYVNLFPCERDLRAKLKALSSEPIMYCLESGMSYGAYVCDELVGFILCFDYSCLSDVGREMIFGSDSPVHAHLTGLDKILFELSVAVCNKYRRRGIASKLVDVVLGIYSGWTMVSDVSNTASLPIYLNRGFSVIELEKDYNLVMRTI